MNQSEIDIMFTTGIGIRVQEANGLLNVIVALPENYREISAVSVNTSRVVRITLFPGRVLSPSLRPVRHQLVGLEPVLTRNRSATHLRREPVVVRPLLNALPHSGSAGHLQRRAAGRHHHAGLRRHSDGLSADGGRRSEPLLQLRRAMYAWGIQGPAYIQRILGRLDRNLQVSKLFQSEHKPIFDPISFANPNYEPVFDIWRYGNLSVFASFVFSLEEVKVRWVPALPVPIPCLGLLPRNSRMRIRLHHHRSSRGRLQHNDDREIF